MARKEGGNSIPLFTDKFVALEYCENSLLLDEATMIPVNDAKELVEYLRLIEGMGDACEVVLDPKSSSGKATRFWPIAYAIER
jgi:hypothetical protein